MIFSDATIERYLAGELSEETSASLERALATDAVLKARVDSLKAEREAFFAADPPAAFAHRLMTRLEVAKDQSVKVPWWRSALIPVFATTAVLLLGVSALMTFNHETSPDAANIAAQQAPPPVTVTTPAPSALPAEPPPPTMEQPKTIAAPEGAVTPKADAPRERAGPSPKKAKVQESVMDPNDNRVSDELSRKDADDSLRGAGSGLGIGSGAAERREYAKAPPPVAKEEAPRDEPAPTAQLDAKSKDKDSSPAKSAAPAAAKPRSDGGGAYGYAEVSVETEAKGKRAESEKSAATAARAPDASSAPPELPTLRLMSKSGPLSTKLAGQSHTVTRGKPAVLQGDWPGAHVALVSVEPTGQVSTLYQGPGQNVRVTLRVNGPMTLVLLRSSQPLQLDALAAKAAKLQEKAMSLTFIPAGIEKRFVRLLVED